MPVQGNEAFSGQGLEIRSPLHCGPSQYQEEFGSFQVTALTHLIGARQVLPPQPGRDTATGPGGRGFLPASSRLCLEQRFGAVAAGRRCQTCRLAS